MIMRPAPLLLGLVVGLAACTKPAAADKPAEATAAKPKELLHRSHHAMGTQITITAYTDAPGTFESACKAAFDEFDRLEALLTVWRNDSDVSKVNAQAGKAAVKVGPETLRAVQVALRFEPAAGRAVIDFAGTSAQLPDNFNAPEAVVRAACLYVIRTLIDTDIPMNDGFLRPVEIRIPAGSMLSPRHPAAVVAGNVETSQLVTDALFGAFGALAASQGTMNNFTFGNDTHQYYETIAGGAGAGPGFAGADAVQTHMTNSRLTDPEILEARFPVLLERFAIRRGSGGAGRWHGGDGLERRIRFLAPMRAEILSNRRKVAPFGLAGGGDGAVGHNRVERADGRVEELSATASVEMAAGDVFVIETPGGGGFGED